ncbi:ARMT1-like domain-containing protein [Thermococcus indicus]|uniref:ARMT1-like domain-containing protein n=1 Tax=Thermococcus indicus TaxID=2586643 RepID=UPI0030B8302E
MLEFIRGRFPDLRIYVAAKDGPIINDATVGDLLEAGFDRFAEVISTGSRLPGTPLEYASEEFRGVFNAADVIIAKGQANFETLSDLRDRRVFFLLKAKCPPIARELGVEGGSLLCVRGGKIDD